MREESEMEGCGMERVKKMGIICYTQACKFVGYNMNINDYKYAYLIGWSTRQERRDKKHEVRFLSRRASRGSFDVYARRDMTSRDVVRCRAMSHDVARCDATRCRVAYVRTSLYSCTLKRNWERFLIG